MVFPNCSDPEVTVLPVHRPVVRGRLVSALFVTGCRSGYSTVSAIRSFSRQGENGWITQWRVSRIGVLCLIFYLERGYRG
jgi:hypothetical protein